MRAPSGTTALDSSKARDRSTGRLLAVVPVECRFEHMAVNQRLRALLDVGDVDVIASYPDSIPRDITARCRIYRLPLSGRISQSTVRRLTFSVEVVVWSAIQRARRQPYRVVYAIQDASALAGMILQSSGTRCVVDVLDDPWLEMRNLEQQGNWRRARLLKIRDRLTRRILRSADLVTTVGSSDEDLLPAMLRERYGVDSHRILPLRQAIDIRSIAASLGPPKRRSQPRKIFYVGWVSAARGIDTLIAATDLLRSNGEQVELRLAGWGDDDSRLRREIEDRRYVSYLGLLPSSMVRDEILDADICCCPFPDRAELAPVQPVKMLEYLALGRPTVGSRLPGIAAVIEHERSGLLVTPGSAESLAKAFERILHDDQFAARLAEGARERAAEFDCVHINRHLQQRIGAWL